MPGLTEEILFRGCLVRSSPAVQEDAYLAIGTGSSKRPPLKEQIANLAIFVLYHFGLGHEQPVYMDPEFLVILVIGGWSFQEALIRTGSIWPSVVIHWLAVWIWITFQGGEQRLIEGGNLAFKGIQDGARNSTCR
mmetsp:Transcript_46584/g.81059  ORF Transcript_46584/g.81059 Transcript_46584/m.81059 type:complete len:135 (+) Transcript_46584:3-407(+)